MDKIETYEPEIPGELEFQPKELGWLKTICIFIPILFLGGGLAFFVVVTGMTPQFLTDQDCLTLQNENFINGSQLGYTKGAYDISIGVLVNDTMPVFLTNGTHITIEYLNMSVYYLNKLNLMEVNEHGKNK